MQEYIVYGRPGCGYCTAAVNLLKSKELPFRYIDIFQENISPQKLNEIVGRSVQTVPQILHGKEYVGGFTDLQKSLRG